MPRHAARLVLGRSARATLPLKPRGFSTTPRRLDDDDASKPTRRERSVAAASALGAMSRPSEPTHTSPERKSQVLDARRLGANRPTTVVRPANLGAKPNVISVQSLPQRPGGASGSFVRRVVFDDNRGGRPPPQGNAAPTGRFVGRSAGPGGSRPSQPYNGSRGRFQARPGGGGAARGGFGGARGGGGMRGRPKGAKKARSDSDKKKDEDERNNGGMSAMSEDVKAYVREQEVGELRAYTPSTTLESLVGWGPAVATATALGQADITMRNVRIMGGGRANVEGEQSFKINEVKHWLARNKPIFFSSIEQKKAVMETLSHEKKEKVIQANMDATVMEIQKKAGNNWGAFVEAFKAWAANMPSTELGKKLVKSVGEHATPEAWLRATAEHKANANLQALAEGYKTQNTKTTREAIAKYALKGEHPEVKYAEDVWGKLAMYHAHGSTYRISDGEKFDEKMRKLIRVPVAGKAAPKAQARA
ncbi:hypothetical protein VP1G_08669 [Cytospora mali]|uniref:Uncharacterized protein n=1 Tax=Cytospora mali TaxID=578113 RepID=A0A194VBW2_CYTMA|nr:hypothetical protein VP1G_08669 [Valsa mali var. pyri (nom. inval.)]